MVHLKMFPQEIRTCIFIGLTLKTPSDKLSDGVFLHIFRLAAYTIASITYCDRKGCCCMTTLFGIAILVSILALIEGICICTRRKLYPQKKPADCYLLLPILEFHPDWQAELNHLFSDLQWQESLQTARIYLLLPEEETEQSIEIRQYCRTHSRFQCGTFSELEKILLDARFPSKNDCILSKEIV